MHNHSHAKKVAAQQEELDTFVRALFLPNDLVEIRAVENWIANDKKQSRLVDRLWLRAEEIGDHFQELLRLNLEHRSNIYFGVNPRTEKSGTKTAVKECRVVWCDFDHVLHSEAKARWRRYLPDPSVVVNSGHGIHAYWILERAVVLDLDEHRRAFEEGLKNLCQDVGSDFTHDVTRLFRLPGFMNMKGAQAGVCPVPCKLEFVDSASRHDFALFARWFTDPRPSAKHETPLAGLVFTKHQDSREIRSLLNQLTRETTDRSRADFAVTCRLLELGLTPPEIYALVKDLSKFACRGQAYFETTIKNALRHLGR